ncbi:hypothetical protein GCK32_004139 [Trichostrongylus colubriformis]|uniref:Uncharacterized protein n=1 Tax=Trichostrongylus colubriformis TaxID=6319 RepID=A0AAN8IKF3_TRICO
MFSEALAAFLLSAINVATGAYELPSALVGGMCPGNVRSLNIDCDPKNPWPRCPPQTYCYATDNVDMGPYYCCPSRFIRR